MSRMQLTSLSQSTNRLQFITVLSFKGFIFWLFLAHFLHFKQTICLFFNGHDIRHNMTPCINMLNAIQCQSALHEQFAQLINALGSLFFFFSFSKPHDNSLKPTVHVSIFYIRTIVPSHYVPKTATVIIPQFICYLSPHFLLINLHSITPALYLIPPMSDRLDEGTCFKMA